MCWPMARIMASMLAALWAPSTITLGVWLIISIRPGMVVLARPSIALASLIGKPRALSLSMTAQRQAAVDRLVLAHERHGQMLELAVGGGQADAIVRPKHPAGFEAIAEFDASCR